MLDQWLIQVLTEAAALESDWFTYAWLLAVVIVLVIASNKHALRDRTKYRLITVEASDGSLTTYKIATNELKGRAIHKSIS